MSLITNFIDKSCPDLIKNDIAIHIINDELMTCTLNKADIANNCNKFFIIQLLKRKDMLSYFILTRSGRVGYSGTDNIDCFLIESVAVDEFKNMFYDKTGYKWEDRHSAQKKTDKYDYIEMKYEKPEEMQSVLEDTKNITLPAELTKLIVMIFDENLYKQIAETYGLDTKRAPLGAISSAQIKKAYVILNKIATLVSDTSAVADADGKVLASLSSDFYTVIPTSYGMVAPPVIDSTDMIETKIELLKLLDNVEILSKLLKYSFNTINKVEKQYLSLDTDIVPVTDPHEYKMLCDYKTKSSGTHYKLNIENIYKVSRHEEISKFKTWQNTHNRQLLWHGSGVANYVGILSSGLRINPGNVVKTGSMFGNGIYFANCCTKSAQYMKTNDTGILLLCDVALGNCYEKLNAEYITKLPAGYHSTHGVGQYTPAKREYVTLPDGLIVPMGKLEARPGHTGALYYDEFIVYDQSQIRIKYLFIVKIK